MMFESLASSNDRLVAMYKYFPNGWNYLINSIEELF